jgi:hypothetical protein
MDLDLIVNLQVAAGGKASMNFSVRKALSCSQGLALAGLLQPSAR